ncbi:MAG TPA: hypothetical protein VKA06_03440, partial [Spirochaetia bacterium]|nr:hypothetical protein [Spirochaetia bacterium]
MLPNDAQRERRIRVGIGRLEIGVGLEQKLEKLGAPRYRGCRHRKVEHGGPRVQRGSGIAAGPMEQFDERKVEHGRGRENRRIAGSG